jgi:CheY-like chemotaxis protein
LNLKTDLPSRGPVVRANAIQIVQALTNLITNAWEAMVDMQGGINLTVKTVSPSGIPASYRFPVGWQAQETDYACIEVADKGCGIAGNDIEKLFDPFFSSKFTGRGLGLSVVLGIARSHSGVVTVESIPAGGSIFRLFLPVSPEEVRRQADVLVLAVTPKASTSPGFNNLKDSGTVLLVEDEEVMRKMAGIMLTHMGYTVITAKDGLNAVDVLRKHNGEIGCVLCDLTMPGMDGWKTMAALRKISPSLPVVLTSGYDREEVMKNNRTDFPHAFLSKPFKLNELGEAIEKAMANKTEDIAVRS